MQLWARVLSDEQTPEGVYLQLAPSARTRLDLIQLPDQDTLESHVVLFTKVIMSHLWPLADRASEDVHFVCKLMMHAFKTCYEQLLPSCYFDLCPEWNEALGIVFAEKRLFTTDLLTWLPIYNIANWYATFRAVFALYFSSGWPYVHFFPNMSWPGFLNCLEYQCFGFVFLVLISFCWR